MNTRQNNTQPNQLSSASFMFHNPRCSKSRRTLELLQEQDIDFDIIEYLDTPLSAELLQDICKTLECNPIDIIRTNENRFSELGLSSSDQRPDSEWIEIMAANPILIERPIFCHNNRAAMGRPPENVLTIL
jgi:arsenate reductase